MLSFTENNQKFVSQEEMERIYNALPPPYKKGAVMKFLEELCDSPTVFR